jgi:5-oxoprolinase (ATP-hydrolysing) subunit A
MRVPSGWSNFSGSMRSVDLNCDMGEGLDNDGLIMPYISSANIACGYHAGDEHTIRSTIELALQHGVAVGAHPSFNDKKNFGRSEMHLTANELFDTIAEQLHLLQKIAKECGAALHHVKPHGALYNMVARDEQMSATIASAIKQSGADLVLYGLSGSYLISEARKAGLRTASEVFADRTYLDNGQLTPRSQPGALIEDASASVSQVLTMILENQVRSITGKPVALQADTICIHGDGTHAVTFAKTIYRTLKENGIAIKTC